MYVGTWVIFGVILAPVYVMLMGWFLGKPRDIRKSLLGLSYLIGLTVLLWGGMFAISMVFKFVFFESSASVIPVQNPASVSESEQITPPRPIPTSISSANIYASRCSACHGMDRQGTPGLAPSLTQGSIDAIPDDEIKTTISNGRPGTAMPPFSSSLSLEEIDGLLHFLRDTP